jgi:acyl-CoA reductase-like NAD-dependent aldehyde dehydrogenase
VTERLPVRKTYKLYVGGAFPRSESGRTYPVESADGSDVLAWVAQASRKDLRDAVRAARGAQPGWASRTAYNRGQVLYRVAEVLEGRRASFAEELSLCGVADPDGEVTAAVDRWVWYAGWADKITQVAGTLNPVAGPYWSVSSPQAIGVVGVVAPSEPPLLGLVDRLAPALAGGNAVVALASERWPLAAVSFGEVLATSDVPGGVVNLLTGRVAELAPWFGDHLDIDAVDVTGLDPSQAADVQRRGAANVKRIVRQRDEESPHEVLALMETKSVWHPIAP